MLEFDVVRNVIWASGLVALTYIMRNAVRTLSSSFKQPQYPVVTNLWPWAPRFLLNLSFAKNALMILEEGYQEFKNRTFQVVRSQGNMVILPLSMLEELATVPQNVASPHAALEHDLLGPYTGLNLILESRIHHAIVQRKLTPRLPLLTPAMESELRHAVVAYFPVTSKSDWTEFQPYQLFGKVAAGLTGRALVGPKLYRDKA